MNDNCIDPAEAAAKFSDYCDEIESFLNDSFSKEKHWTEAIKYILNGGAISALQRLVPLSVRKRAGMFFTNTEIAHKVASRISSLLQEGVDISDPACGAGNLLVACSQYLPVCSSFETTVQNWSDLIKGSDLFPEFIRAARLRLIIAAANRHRGENINLSEFNSERLFNNLKVGNAFSITSVPSKCIVVNPPFGYMTAPGDCTWGHGKIQIAGWFMEKLLHNATTGQHLVAVLPDVLNSGSRYKRWRDVICGLASIIDIEQIGRFDLETDVDVFIIHLIAGNNYGPIKWPNDLPGTNQPTTISDYFDIHVGTIVPHRDILQGKSYPYIHARTAIPWQTLESISETRQTDHKVFRPPFVVVHRTSSPSDKHRCVGTIINESTEVAVENHLIVLSPKDDSLKICRQLLESLRCPETDEWINRRIRCRHLTVSALNELPYYRLKSKGDQT